MRTRMSTAILAAGLIFFTACGADNFSEDPTSNGGTTDADSFPITVENCGREVIFDAPPERVLALGGEAGTLLWAAGATESISTFVSVEGEPLGDAEQDLLARPQLEIPGSGEIPLEVIVGEEPDLVVTFGLNSTTPEDLEAAGIKTLFITNYCDGSGTPDFDSPLPPFESIYADIELYGELLGTADQATAAVADLADRVAAVQEEFADASTASAAALFVFDAESPLGAYGNLALVNQQMQFLGLTNVFADTEERYFEPSIEAFIEGNPDVVIALYQADASTEQDVLDALSARPEIAQVAAIADQRILVIDFFFTGNGILAVDGLELLAEQLAA